MLQLNNLNSHLKNILLFILFTLIYLLGYIRETSFLVINSVLRNYSFPYNSAYVSPPTYILEMSNGELIILKWALTLIFSLLFLGITLLTVHLYFKSKKFNRVIFYIYSLIITLSFVIYLFGVITGLKENCYTISRFIIGLVQYPILSLILFALFYFITKSYSVKK